MSGEVGPGGCRPLIRTLPAVPESVGHWLAQLARIEGETRLYDLWIEGCEAPLWVESFAGVEAVSTLSDYRIQALSTDAAIDLQSLRWRRARLRIRLADGSEQHRSGYVRAASARRADGGLARYELQLVPWNWLLTQQTHSRIWQDQPLIDILSDVFSRYEDAHWALADGVETLLAQRPARRYCVQYRESDHGFVTRLLAEEGLGWTYVEDEDAEARSRLVVFADSTRFPDGGGVDGIRFHRAAAAEQADSIQRLELVQRLPARVARVAAFDPLKKVSLTGSALATSEASAGDSTRDAQEPSGPVLERYLWSGHGAIGDAEEAARRSALMQEAQDAAARQFIASGSVRSLRPGVRFRLTQSLLDSALQFRQAGPESDQLAVLSVRCAGLNHLPSERQAALDALSAAIDDLHRSAAGCASECATRDEDLQALVAEANESGYAARYRLQPANVVWRPASAGVRPRATAPGPQSAVVVDAHGTTGTREEIHRDRLGRIRVRFHWQQDAGNDVAHGSASSAWLRIASRSAGGGRGASFVPRLGQEVLVGFLDQDIDQPIVLGALYNGRGEGGPAATPGGEANTQNDDGAYRRAADRQASAQGNVMGGNSPAWHGHSPAAEGHQNPSALSGYKTSEFGNGGVGYNQLAFDDRDDSLRIQLKTTQATSELNLGHLIHQADNHLGSVRGSGYELRTDEGGTIRAARGVLLESRRGLTPSNQPEAIGDFTAGTSLLAQAQRLATGCDRLAETHRTTGLSLSRGSVNAGGSRLDRTCAPVAAFEKIAQTAVSSEDGSAVTSTAPHGGDAQVPHLGASIVALSAKAELGVIAGQALQLAAGETIAMLSGRDHDQAIGGRFELHSGQSVGMLAGVQHGAVNPALSMIAAQGAVRVEAQNSGINVDAKQDVKLISISASLEAGAKTAITLNTQAGALIRIEGGNIEVHCPGQITVHAAQHAMAGPTQQGYPLPAFPNTVCVECLLKAQAHGAAFAPK